MSWERFDNLSISKQQKVLREVFLKTGLMYDVTTDKGLNALKGEYHFYESVRLFVEEAMGVVL